MKLRNAVVGAATLGVLVCGGFAASASAQAAPASAGLAASPAQLKRENLSKLLRQVPDVNFQDHRLEDVIRFVREITGAEIEPLWVGEQNAEGLNPDALVTLQVKRVSALKLLEMVLEKVEDDTAVYSGGNSWQMTDWGTLEVGPKNLLARHMRLEVYPINDLLWEIPNYTEAPEIDLQSVLQSSGGGGGAQSPFQQNQQQDVERRTIAERAEEVVDIIEALVEPEQWLSGGGTASIRYFQGNLLVRAPDFVHRQLGGYPWWPDAQTAATVVNGRRYVSLDVDTGISTIDGIVNQPVTGVVGGGPPGPGGG
ncbi:MAG TPA: hypothetical protein VFF69_00255 [Phycisphaerales bacterium]|nr:hypothetical protein [Phycisphaerales bacterium]